MSREAYEVQRQLPNRNFATDHSYEEWRDRDVVSLNKSPKHSCPTCMSPEYRQAEEIIARSGLEVRSWGYLLHDIAAALMKAGEGSKCSGL